MTVSQKITALRKSGNLEEAEHLAVSELKENFDNRYLQNAYGWVIYARLKEAADLSEQKKIGHGKLMSVLTRYTREYAKLNCTSKPDLLHSLIMTQVLKTGKGWPAFLGFARWWGADNFREEDHEPFRLKNGKTVSSLSQRYFYRIGHAIAKHYAESSSDDLDWGKAQLDSALRKDPKDQWLNYYKSKLLLLEGEYDAALKSFIPVIKRQKGAFWTWAHFGDIWSNSDRMKAIICYQHAVNLSREPLAIVNVHEKMARLLVLEERYAEAVVQVNNALKIREDAGLHNVPQSLLQLFESDWYKQVSKEKLPVNRSDVSEPAENILYESIELEPRKGVVDNQNVQKGLAHVSFAPDDGVVLFYKKFMGIQDVEVGSVVSVVFEKGESFPVKWKGVTEDVVSGLLEYFTGVLEQPLEKKFGFIRTENNLSIFVPPSLMESVQDLEGKTIHCKAILSMGKKKGKPGWQALVVEEDRN